MKSFCRFVLVLFAAAIGLILAQASAQTLLPSFQFQPTAQDVDPGVDHGNTEAGLPYEYQKQMVAPSSSILRSVPSI